MTRRVDDAAILAGLAAGLDDHQIADAVGCAAVTVRRRRQDPEVQAELRHVRSSVMRRNLDRLGHLVALAIDRVEAALHDADTSPAVAVSALRAAVAAFADHHDRDEIVARLETLEATMTTTNMAIRSTK